MNSDNGIEQRRTVYSVSESPVLRGMSSPAMDSSIADAIAMAEKSCAGLIAPCCRENSLRLQMKVFRVLSGHYSEPTFTWPPSRNAY